MNKNKLIILILIIIILAGIGFYLFLREKTGEEGKKVYRIGILFGLEQLYDSIDGFKKGMEKLGYTEGKNIIYDTHKTNVDLDADRQIINQFVADKVDLIFMAPTETILLAKEIVNGKNIPLVFADVVLEGNDLIKNVKEPGGYITGVRLPGPEYTAKRLEILHEIMPNAKRVWVTYDPNNPNNPPTFEALRSSASLLGITLVEIPVTSVAEVKADLEIRDGLDDTGIDAIITVPDWLSLSPECLELIDDFSIKHKIPIVYAPPIRGATAEDIYPKNIIFSYMCDFTETGELAAVIADKILKGTPAGLISIVTPEARLKINYKAIQELDLTIPEDLLIQADEIIK